MSENNSIYSKPILFSIVALVVILVGSVVTAFYPLAQKEMHPVLDTLKPYSAIELAGRDVYQREGCSVCHSQNVRALKTEVLRYGDYSKAGESAYERPFLWGSRRVGPDLARIGGKYDDEWHMQHMLNPQHFAAKSNMPKYPWLATAKANATATEAHMKGLGYPYTPEDIQALAGKTELEALVAYLQRIGTAVEPFQLVTVTEEDYTKYGDPMKGKPEAALRGKTLFASECSGCHGMKGEGNIGPDISVYGADMDDMTAFLTIANGTGGAMPGFINTMTRDQVASIVEYLRTMAAENAAAETQPAQ